MILHRVRATLGLGFIACLWLATLAVAQASFDPTSLLHPNGRPIDVMVSTWPPDATLYLIGNNGLSPVGRGNATAHVEVPAGSLAVKLVVSADGYVKQTIVVPTAVGGPSSVTLPPVHLTALHAWVDLVTVVRCYPLSSLLFIVALVTIGTLWVGPRLKRLHMRLTRARHLEALIASDEETDQLSGKLLGSYRMCGRIAEGGMAFVYRAVPNDTLAPSESVAIKVMKPELFSDVEVKERFRREVQILRKLSHPLIARILDWGEQRKLLYLVTELVRGETMRERVSEQGMPVSEALRLLEPVFQAVTYLHTKGVVHRNLKPENIMVQSNGKIKIIDFGLARGVGSSRLTGNGVVLGTPAYMAPEQVKGEDSDHRTDQYSLGILVYELLTGKKPFRANNKMTLMHMQVSDTPPSLLDQRADLPPPLNDVVQRMLAKDPEDRYASVDEAWKDVAKVGAFPGFGLPKP